MFNKLLVLFLYGVALITVTLLAWNPEAGRVVVAKIKAKAEAKLEALEVSG